MSNVRFSPTRPLRLLTLAAALLGLSPAWADDYADVAQLLRAGKTSEALSKADQFLSSKPRDPQMRFLRGVILSETGKTSEAITSFARLTEDYPELPEPYNNLAVLYAGQNQFDKARAALESAIRTNPSYATAHENLGDIYARLASQAYNRALQLDTSNATVPPKLGLIRELFSPTRATQRPVVAAAPAPAPASTPVPAAPVPAPAPVPVAKAPAPAVVPAPVPVTAPAAKTPPAPVAVPPPATAAAAPATADVEAAVRAWAAAWSSKDIGGYLKAYGSDFDPPGKLSRKDWEEERRSRIVGKSRISVKLSDMRVQMDGNKATVKFRQSYSADSLNVSSRKTLELRKAGERWVIVRESTGA